MRQKILFIKAGLALAPFVFFTSSTFAQDINWGAVEGKEITLFYPGQAAWEWILTPSSHGGAKSLRAGKTCRDCHEGEQPQMGDLIVSGQKLEPEPIARKRGSIPVEVKFAHDSDNLYIRLEWTEQGADGFPVLDPQYETKVTVMLDDGSVPEATRAGCWGGCHNDASGMPNEIAGLRKYLSKSRAQVTREGGGENYKSDAEIEDLKASGYFLEYWQAKLNHDAAPVAVGGYILENREETTGAGVSATSSYDHGRWIVVLSRPLKGGGDYRKALVGGTTYTFGVAIHEAHSGGRYHHVSFGYTLSLDGGDADFIAGGN